MNRLTVGIKSAPSKFNSKKLTLMILLSLEVERKNARKSIYVCLKEHDLHLNLQKCVFFPRKDRIYGPSSKIQPHFRITTEGNYYVLL